MVTSLQHEIGRLEVEADLVTEDEALFFKDGYAFRSSVANIIDLVGTGFLLPENNLSDVSSASDSRDNLGLGSAATQNSNAFVQPANNLSDVASPSASLANIGGQPLDAGLTSIAGLSASANQMLYATGVDTYALTGLTVFARTLLDDTTSAEARTTLGLGSLATENTVNNANWSGADLEITNGGTGASTIGEARGNLGLGDLAVEDTVTTSQIDAATLVTESDGIGNNDNDTTIPTSAAVVDYVANNATGVVVQSIYSEFTNSFPGTGSIPNDDSIPQNDEGFEVMDITITPSDSSSFIEIEVITFASEAANNGSGYTAALFRDDGIDAIACGSSSGEGAQLIPDGVSFRHRAPASSTTPTTFRVRVGNTANATLVFNGGSGTGRKFGGVLSSSIKVTEYSA